MDTFNPKNFSLPSNLFESTNTNQAPPKHKPGEKFLKGPIPLEWLCMAARQPGKSLHVAVAIWFLAGITYKKTITLQGTILRALGVSRHAAYRALQALEKAGLVTAKRHPGRFPVVTIKSIPSANLDSKN